MHRKEKGLAIPQRQGAPGLQGGCSPTGTQVSLRMLERADREKRDRGLGEKKLHATENPGRKKCRRETGCRGRGER